MLHSGKINIGVIQKNMFLQTADQLNLSASQYTDDGGGISSVLAKIVFSRAVGGSKCSNHESYSLQITSNSKKMPATMRPSTLTVDSNASQSGFLDLYYCTTHP